jgi:Holliday junction DNA helicase RuvB
MPLVKTAIANCNSTGKLWGHTLLFGPPGVGKTSLSMLLAKELGYEFVSLVASKTMTAPILSKVLLDLDVRGYGPGGQWQPGAKKFIVFLDECAALKQDAWESVLYTATEDFELHNEKGVTFWLPDFALLCATTNPYALPVPALSRLTLKLHLEPYSIEELGRIVARVYPNMSAKLIDEVAMRSKGIARIALAHADGVNDHGMNWWKVCSIDERGLNDLDRAYLAALESGPLSLNTIANIVRESPKTLTAMVEPELLRMGLISIGREGRCLNDEGRGSKVRT